RRKVKCSKNEPCDRCVSAGLRCTRDIARKKRGPKKGSGSVIAKLRDESHNTSPQDPNRQSTSAQDQNMLFNLQSYDLTQMRLQLPSLNRAMTNDIPLDAPLTSPTGSHFGDGYGSTLDPTIVPRSFPVLQNGVEFEPTSHTAFAQAGIQLPASWQM